LCVTLSYTGVLKVVTELSKLHKVPLSTWLQSGVPVKFVGDNVDKKKGVRDIRSDHRGQLVHMYSLLAVKGRVPFEGPSTARGGDLSSREPSSFLPTEADVDAIKHNLTVLVGRTLTTYIKCLQPLSKVLPAHIHHNFSVQMAQKSEVFFLDVLMKNEANHSDMLDIMKVEKRYLGENSPIGEKVLSGGDQLTCKRQVGSKRHVMDGNTPKEHLQVLEPVCEDWHALMCFLTVS